MRRFALLALFMASLLLIALPSVALADGPGTGVAGGCQVVGTSTSGGEVDLSATGVWHIQSSDVISVAATAPSTQDSVVVNALLLGYPVPIVTDSGSGTGGTASYAVADFAAIARVFLVQGSSSGSGSACTGQIQIIIDDLSPLETPLGVGAAATAVVGLATVLVALRVPGRFGGRLASVIGFGLSVAGAAILIGQFSDGSVGGLASTVFVQSVPGPTGITTDPTVLIQAAVASVLLVLVMPFPAEVFNKTVEEHLDEIRGWFGRLPLVGGLAGGDERRWRSPLAIAGFVGGSALLYGLLSPGFTADLRGLVTWGGTGAALIVTAWTAAVPRRAMQEGRNADRGRLVGAFGTLGVAVACVAISRATGFLPGYLYGLLLGYRFLRELTPGDEGRAVHAGAWWMLLIAAVSWLLLDATRATGVGSTVPGALLSTVLATLVVGGIEGIVFALIPMRFLYGAHLFGWSRVRWSLLYGIGLFGFLVIVLNPANGFVATANPAALPTAIGLFIGFGVLSFGTWAFFRFRKSPAPV
jgi:hypothetical protein